VRDQPFKELEIRPHFRQRHQAIGHIVIQAVSPIFELASRHFLVRLKAKRLSAPILHFRNWER
jgi:hypothetical protein